LTEWRITQKPSFLSELLALPPKEVKQVQQKLLLLSQDPTPDAKVKKQLKGWSGRVYRLRAGDYRIFYTFDDPFISLLALRRRAEDTYDEDIEPEDLGGFAPKLAAGEKAVVSPSYWENTADEPRSLPEPITTDLLRRLHIADAYHERLLRIKDEDQLLACPGVPDDILLRLHEVMFERPLQDVLEQPDLITEEMDDLFRFKKGDLPGFLLKLSPEQEQLVELNLYGNSPTLVKGGPGSGKSIVALYRAAAVLRVLRKGGEAESEPRILFTTYTNALIAFSRGLLQALLGEDYRFVEVSTADSQINALLEEGGERFSPATQEELLDAMHRARAQAAEGGSHLERMQARLAIEHLTDDYLIDEVCSLLQGHAIASVEEYLAHPRKGRIEPLSEAQRRIIWRIRQAFESRLSAIGRETWSQARAHAARLVRDGRIVPRYDGVLIDEAQDLEPAAISVLAALCKNRGRLFLTADANQSIYGSSFRWSDVHRELETASRASELTANFRSTREIAVAAQSYLGDAQIDYDAGKIRYVHEGPLPVARRVSSRDEEVDLLDRFLRGAARELRLTIGACAVLCPSAKVGKSLAERLSQRGVPAKFMLSREFEVGAQCIKVLPLKSAKGLEFPIVAVAGLWPPYPYMPPNAMKGERDERLSIERRTLYVAMTRAMRALLVCIPRNSSSSLFEGFDSTLWNYG
jgi:superfamily I DNA/RNA helicase/mRNA-degrading endonuclease RelE of RelBE toxin-antitoxin system